MSGIYSLGFFGRPLPGTLRIASKSSSVYRASCEKGLRPALSNRLFIVSRGNSSFSAISEIVMPCITFIIVMIQHFFNNVYIKEHLLYNRIAKIREKIKKVPKKEYLALTICSF